MKMTVCVSSMLFLLIVCFSVGKSSGKVYTLDMAENSVDDSYDGCNNAMTQKVESNYINNELNNNPQYSAAWKNAVKDCKIMNPLNRKKNTLKQNQCAAIKFYTMAGPSSVFTEFNTATRDGKAAYLSNNFRFYTLHFYLTDAVKQLKPRNCETTYRRTKEQFDVSQTFRFGSFTSTSVYSHLKHFGEEHCFEIKTCFGAKITKYSSKTDEDEVLIPPYEVFKLTATKNKNEHQMKCNKVYVVESTNKELSELNCKLINPV